LSVDQTTNQKENTMANLYAAELALNTFISVRSEPDTSFETDIIDLVTDLLHLYSRESSMAPEAAEMILRCAANHFKEELNN
jgi:hypothetical protein